jgi:Uma2 family endonuclease
MATQTLDRYTLEHYLKIEDSLEYRSEFHDGVILPVEDATPTQARLGSRVGSILERAFMPCAVYCPSLNIYIASANKILKPDATVICGTANGPKPDCVDNPAIIVEVTSPSTKDYDYGSKREHYFSLPSLEHYLLVSQTERKVGHYERSGSGWMYVDRVSDAVIFLSGREVSVDGIYSGILA